jgi:hypothetical protein
LIGSALISAIRASLSGTTLIRPIFAKSPVDLITSAVPSQLLPTNITSRRSAAAACAALGAEAAVAVPPSVKVRATAAASVQRCLGLRTDMVGPLS